MIIYETSTEYKKVGTITHKTLDEPEAVQAYMVGAFDEHPMQEQVWVIMLNRKNFPIGRQMVTLGTNVGCLLNPSSVFRPVIVSGATACILCHNHPSGDPSPSSADMQVTKKIAEAGKALDIAVHDHVIIGHESFYSFNDKGLL
ncbi:MAG: hypothetical protein CMC82_01805 [Flavobacteriaceae bacterium]|nr:hypothetical protein [Flavobacteriaceae bacterium]|tara:strand:+ start:1592 stop:2023 length:432 start_codon:yes stop_codon:yes gene_type:complete